jgi:signal peptidase I
MSTATATAPADEKEKDKKKPPRDPAREVVETVVFVVVLVLLLKLFVTEAFVIPTGSMAETLYGYQKIIDCPKCGCEFPVNSHDEVEGVPGPGGIGPRVPQPVVKYVCPNCRYHGLVASLAKYPQNRSGDRVLVLKPLYHLREPHRGDVVVFKFPKNPQENHVAANYIKRAMGFGGETVAIFRGDLYVTTALEYPEGELFPRPADPLDLWRPLYMYHNSGRAENLFEASRKAGFPPGPIKDLPPERYDLFKKLVDAKEVDPTKPGFTIVRKGEGQLLADRRIVWDNDKQAQELAGVVPPRWYAAPEGAAHWAPDNPDQPRAFSHTGGELNWIRYRHLSMQWKTAPPNRDDPVPQTAPEALRAQAPTFVDNFLAYNASRPTGSTEALWVGDLILECEAEIAAGSEVTLELSRGANRFQATFGNGQVTLRRVGPKAAEFGERSRPCKVKEGTYQLRFANVDARLWVWVDGKHIDFGAEADYGSADQEHYEANDAGKQGWTQANDIDAPASIGAKGPVPGIRGVKLKRDIYYTTASENSGGDSGAPDIYYVQPGHYMCLGDNSAHSSDSREWGTVPERLMLGKAVFVFWPAYPPPNRVGFIK